MPYCCAARALGLPYLLLIHCLLSAMVPTEKILATKSIRFDHSPTKEEVTAALATHKQNSFVPIDSRFVDCSELDQHFSSSAPRGAQPDAPGGFRIYVSYSRPYVPRPRIHMVERVRPRDPYCNIL